MEEVDCDGFMVAVRFLEKAVLLTVRICGQARVRAISEIVAELLRGVGEGWDVNLNTLKSEVRCVPCIDAAAAGGLIADTVRVQRRRAAGTACRSCQSWWRSSMLSLKSTAPRCCHSACVAP